MGFDTQPNLWECGPFALKHALLTLGVNAEVKKISKLAGTHWRSGTDESQLIKAARKFKVDLGVIRRLNPEKARKEMVGSLRRGHPVLLCIYEWAHWVTVVKEERGKFIVMDSQDKHVLNVLSWSQLRNQWVFHEEDEMDEQTTHTYFDFHPVVPRFRVKSRARFRVSTVHYLRRKENAVLGRLWDEFVNDLLALCTLRTPLSEKVISMGEFLRRNESVILDQLDFWHGGIERRKAAKILEWMHVAADTLDMVVRTDEQKRAIVGITTILTLWAASKYGSVPLYEIPKRKKKRR